MESVLQRITIIGEILAFRELLHKAVHDVLETRLPFLLSSVHNLHESCGDHDKLVSLNCFLSSSLSSFVCSFLPESFLTIKETLSDCFTLLSSCFFIKCQHFFENWLY